MKIVFMGTPDFGLKALDKINKNYDLKLVVCQPDRINRRGKKIEFSPIKKYAIENDIELYQPDNINSEESIEKISSLEPDFIVVAAYGQFIGKAIRNIPKENIVNIHASLLPRWRGAAPINYAIMNGDKKTGISIMKVSKVLDGGEVYIQKEIEIGDKNYDELYASLSEIGAELIIKYLDDKSNWQNGGKQDEERVTLAPCLDKNITQLDFENMLAKDLVNLVKAMSKKPGATAIYDGTKFKITDARLTGIENKKYKSATIVKSREKEIIIAAKDELVQILELQFPGKKPMKTEEFLLGNSLEEGKILGK
ncbi:MAG: methionyl-tRNA formyltransferase [Tissierellia bacterium]|nr:methionyl-tRNA formyltransferase [Tissierellia bacterium]